MKQTAGLGIAILMSVCGTHFALAESLVWRSAYLGTAGSFTALPLDPFSQRFAAYNGDLANPFANSKGYTSFSVMTDDTQLSVLEVGAGHGFITEEGLHALADWATSMTTSYGSPTFADSIPDASAATNNGPVGDQIAHR